MIRLARDPGLWALVGLTTMVEAGLKITGLT